MTQIPNVNAEQIAECVERFRVARPHVHCITNTVAQNFTANVLLAAGGVPSMTIAAEEISDFVKMSDALLINLGTLDDERRVAVEKAVDTANQFKKPWVVDPVFVQASPLRLAVAKQLLDRLPSLVRCNANEFQALFQDDPNAISVVAQRHGTSIALTGQQDHLSDGSNAIVVSNGSPLMANVTAMGCALTALMIGFHAVISDKLLASVSATVLFGLAGEYAERNSQGPGTAVPKFLDALAGLNTKDIVEGAKIS